MKKLFILLLAIFSCSGSNGNKTKVQNDNNIIIKSAEFKTVIRDFYQDALYYSPPGLKNDTISVSIWKNKNEINVSLNSFVKLKSEYYIGETDLDSLKILFYTNNLENTKDFIEVKFSKKDTVNKQVHNEKLNRPPTYIETYEKFYTYKDGKLKLMRMK